MSDKLLHERLRDASGDCIGTVRAVGLSCNDMEKCEECFATLRKALADEIERQYVPVPRFPDGEPVHEGSETRYGTVSCVDVYVSNGGWGNWIMHTDDDNCIEGTFSQCVERPAPKLLDADGVETKAGDTVWYHDKVDGGPVGKPMKVTEVLCNGTLVFEGGGAMPARLVTHREPDSLEKAMERFQGILEDHDGLNPETEDELWKVYSRLTALMERGDR